MTIKKQSGFGAVIIIVLAAITATAGFIAWQLFMTTPPAQAPSQSNQNTKDTPGQQPQQNPNEGYVVIEEWGVRFKPVSGLSGVVYFKPASGQGETYEFSTTGLIEREPNCAHNGFAFLQRSKIPIEPHEQFLSIINGYYYYFLGSSAACSEQSSNYAYESETRNAFKESVSSLQAKKE